MLGFAWIVRWYTSADFFLYIRFFIGVYSLLLKKIQIDLSCEINFKEFFQDSFFQVACVILLSRWLQAVCIQLKVHKQVWGNKYPITNIVVRFVGLRITGKFSRKHINILKDFFSCNEGVMLNSS